MKYNFFFEQYRFGWYLKLPSISPDLRSHLLYLLLHGYFIETLTVDNRLYICYFTHTFPWPKYLLIVQKIRFSEYSRKSYFHFRVHSIL